MGSVSKIKQVLLWGIILLATLAAGTQGKAAGPQEGMGETGERAEAFLYYAAARGTHLTAVSRVFPPGGDARTRGLALLETLISGPPANGLKRVFPENTRINALFVTGSGDAYVDLGLDRERLAEADTMTDYLRVYSLVNTLTVNIPGIRQVKILVNGDEAASLGGHISLDTLFKTNMLIVK